MPEFKQIIELMSAMERLKITKLTLKEKAGSELHLERQEQPSAPPPATAFYPSFPSHEADRFAPHPVLSAHRPPPINSGEEQKAAAVEQEGKYVTSPMVGTFYTAASPDDPAFVKVGDRVEENTVICIIEAMKVMNEVKAGISGVVAELLVENAHPVEFRTKLFRIT